MPILVRSFFFFFFRELLNLIELPGLICSGVPQVKKSCAPADVLDGGEY